MNITNLILGVNSVTVSYLIHYDGLVQKATDIITKCDRSLFQNASGFLLQNATVFTNCDDFITKCDVYYKLRQYIHIKKPKLLKKPMRLYCEIFSCADKAKVFFECKESPDIASKKQI